MSKKNWGATMLLSMMLVSCWQQTSTPKPPVQPTQKSNVFRIQFQDVGEKTLKSSISGFKQTTKGIQPAAIDEISDSLSFQHVSSEVFTVESAGERYVKVRYRVTNNTGKAIENLTFLPFDTDDADADPGNNPTPPTIGDTAFDRISLFDGSQVPALATVMETTRGRIYDVDADAAVVETAATPYLTGLDVGGVTPIVPAGLVNGGVQSEGWQKPGIIPIGGSAVFTFAVKHPLQTPRKNNPYGFSIMVVYAEDPSTSGITKINTIQGSTPSGDAASPEDGNTVTVDAVVTSDLQGAGQLGGFYLQEQTADQDADATTSEGIFVANTSNAVNQGDRVRLTGTVEEVNGETRLTNVTSLIVMATGQSLPTPASITLSTSGVNLEQYEGMRVSTSGTVTDNSLLGRGGLVTIADNNLLAFTQDNAPDATGYAAYLSGTAARTLIVDDGSTTEHPASIVFGRDNNPLTAGNTLRVGDGATVTGVLGYGSSGWTGTDAYRLHATAASATFAGGPRRVAPTSSDLGNPELKVVTFDLNGFFNGDGAGNNFTSEGASNASELTRQLDKLVEALQDLDADVVALQGLENDYADSTPAIKTLVDALNAAIGSPAYAYIDPGANLGSQSTAVGLIYRTAAVTPRGSFSVLDNTDNAAYNEARNHPALAQTFRTTGLGTFTAVAVELEGRDAACGGGADDTTTGQGNCNGVRNTGAQILMDWVATDPTASGDTDVVLLGNFNAFLKEDPINTIINGADDANGTSDDYLQIWDPLDYTAVLNGQRGTLDYAFISPSLQAQLKGTSIWNINAAEPSVLDYNTENKTAAQLTDLYDINPYRSSAHDPVVVGLTLGATNVNPTDITLTPSSIAENNAASATVGALGAADPNTGDTFTYTLVSGAGDTDNASFSISGTDLKLTPSANFETKSSYSVRVRVTDQGGLTYEEALTVTVTDVNEAPTTLSLTGGTINENLAAGASAGTFSTNDPDAGETITYTLVSGTGDTDNASFTIVGDDLRNAATFDFETKSSYSIRVRATDSDNHTVEQQFTITVNDVFENGAPTDITLTPSSIAENNAVNATVGALGAVDPNIGDTFTYTLVSGAGDTDNADFDITSSNLILKPSANFEVKSSYSVRVRVEDQNGAAFEKALTVTVNNVNEDPTDLGISSDTIAENSSAGSTVGTFSTTDVDSGDTFTYSLVSGTGSTDNASFSISGNSLTISASPNFEVKSSYSIRVRTTDAGGKTFEKAFTINVSNVNEAPTALSLTGNSVAENQSSGTAVDSFSTTDVDASDTFTYSLVTGSGDTDNASFQIVGGQLQTAASFNFETKSSYSIRVRTTDAGGLFTENTFTVNVTNVNEAPTALSLSASSINENVAGNSTVGSFSTTDVDSGDTFTYTLVSGSGSTDNASFNISGNSLRITNSPNFEVKSSYSIRVRTTDAGGLFTEDAYTISINDLNEAPVASDDSGFKTVGNVVLDAAGAFSGIAEVSMTGNIDSNDSDPDTNPAFNTLSVVAETKGTTQGGSVTINADGSFVYTPDDGDTGITDSFDYTITDGTNNDTGTVSIELSGRVWFVRNNAPANGLGRSSDPFDTLLEAQTASAANDTIYVLNGDGASTGHTAGIALKTGQRLIGEGAGLAHGDIANTSVLSTDFVGHASGTQPTLSNALNFDVVTGNNVGSVIIKGLKITAQGSGDGIQIDSNTGTNTTTLSNLTVNAGTSGSGVVLNNTAANIHNVALTNLTVTGGSGSGIVLNETAGSLNVTAFDDLTVSGASTGTGITATNANFNSISNATVSVGASGNGTGTQGVLLDGSTGTLGFDTLNVYNDAGTGLKANNASLNLTVSGGNIESTGGPAVDISNAPSNLTFTTVKSTNSTSTGVSLSGASTSTNMSFSAGSGSAISGADGHAFFVNSGTGNISYGGTINKTDGTGGTNAVRITSRNAGTASTISFTGSITDSVQDTTGGVYLDDNDQATINFSGQITANTQSQPAFTAINGGTVSASDTTSTLTTSTGTALNVQNTGIGSNNLKFQSISSNGSVNGIYVSGTGNAGSLSVLGTGSANSGGTIQSTTGHAIHLRDTQSPSLAYMLIQNIAGSGIKGDSNVRGFTLSNSTINNTGTGLAVGDSNIHFGVPSTPTTTEKNISGTVSITNNTLTNAYYHGIDISNYDGTLDQVTITGNTITSSTSNVNSKGSGIQLIANAGSAVKATVTRATLSNNTISNFPSGAGIFVKGENATGSAQVVSLGDPSSPTNVITISGNTIRGQSSANPINTNAIITSLGSTNSGARARGRFEITGNGTAANPITNVRGNVITHTTDNYADAVVNVKNNYIVANQTSAIGARGITITCSALSNVAATGTMTTEISGNTVSQTEGSGIALRVADSNCNTNGKIQNNTVGAPTSGAATYGIRVESGNSTAGVNTTLCLNISGNTSAGFGAATGIGLRKQGTTLGVNTFGIHGLTPSPTNTPETYVDTQNPAGGTTQRISGGNFVSCSNP